MPDSYWANEDISAIEAGVRFSIDLDDEYAYDDDLLLVIHHDLARPVAELIAECT